MTIPDWLAPFLTMDISLWEKVLRTVVVYLGIAILVRVAGKRLLAQMNSLDLVVVLLLSNVVQNAIIGPDNSVLGGVVGAIVLIAFNGFLDRFSGASPFWRWLLVGKGTDLIVDGELDEAALTKLGLTRTELDLALRHQGADAVSEVQKAALEPEGDIVVSLKPGERTVNRNDLDRAVAELKALILSSR
ncbi:MAG: DUF421 domain-containing protein [Propionicimonas sp.]|uniref:DUF421 domain-containing protein n=1 Tax=Propionicimonas sp. TaxID=1955623 RepID=UPI003D12AD53